MPDTSPWRTAWVLARVAACWIGCVIWHGSASDPFGADLTFAVLFRAVPLALGFVGAWDVVAPLAVWSRTWLQGEMEPAEAHCRAWVTACEGLWPLSLGVVLSLIGGLIEG